MRSSSIVAAGLLAAGAAVLVTAAVRFAVLWIVEPGSEVVAPIGALLIGSGIAVLALRGLARPILSASAMLVSAVASGVLARVVAVLASSGPTDGTFVAYGPGTPPSFSWTLLATQVVEPALDVLALLLVVVAIVRFGSALRRTATRRLRAE